VFATARIAKIEKAAIMPPPKFPRTMILPKPIWYLMNSLDKFWAKRCTAKGYKKQARSDAFYGTF